MQTQRSLTLQITERDMSSQKVARGSIYRLEGLHGGAIMCEVCKPWHCVTYSFEENSVCSTRRQKTLGFPLRLVLIWMGSTEQGSEKHETRMFDSILYSVHAQIGTVWRCQRIISVENECSSTRFSETPSLPSTSYCL